MIISWYHYNCVDMPTDILGLRPDLNAVVCGECQHAVHYQRLARHLADVHSFGTPQARAAVSRLPASARLCDGRASALHPPNGGPVVIGLAPPVPGHVCDECGYAAPSHSTIRQHVAKQHPLLRGPRRPALAGTPHVPWKPAWVQTIYADQYHMRYFTVTPEAPPDVDMDADDVDAGAEATDAEATNAEATNAEATNAVQVCRRCVVIQAAMFGWTR